MNLNEVVELYAVGVGCGILLSLLPCGRLGCRTRF